MIKYRYFKINEKLEEKYDEKTLVLKDKKDFNNFLDDLLLTDYIVLKEEKETMFFYSCLTSKTKKLFNIKEYFDSIDVAYNYYKLMSDLYINDIQKDSIKTDAWKLEYLDAIYEINDIMVNEARNKKMVPRYLRFLDAKINERFLKSFDKIVIINKFYTNKKELNILNSLNKEIYYHLYTNKEDYNENNNILENISYDKNILNIKAVSFKDINSILMYLTEYLNDKKDIDICINDLLKNKESYTLLNKNLLDYGENKSFKYSKTYKLLEHIYNVLISNDNVLKLYEAILDKDFVKFFNISDENIQNIKNDLKFSKKYSHLKLEYESLEKLYDRIAKFYKDEAAVFLEAVTEVLTLKDFNFDSFINSSDQNIKLLLKYLNAKTIKEDLKTTCFKVTNPNEKEEENLIMLNLQEDILKSNNNFILDISDRKKLNLISESDLKYVKYYSFLRKIFLAKNILLLYINDNENDISISSIFNELLYKQNTTYSEKEYTSLEKINFVKYIYDVVDKKKDDVFLTKKDNIVVEKGIFDNISLNSYDMYNFFNDELRLYLSKLLKKHNFEEINIKNDSIDNLTIGNIVHKMYEYAIKNKENLSLKEIKEKVLKEYEDYIIKDYIHLYDDLLFDNVLSEIQKFLKENKNLLSEEKLEESFMNIKFNFRQDIIVLGENKTEIVDIKTGKYIEQKDIKKFYQLFSYKLLNEIFNKYQNIDCYFYFPFEKGEKNKSQINDKSLTKEDLENRIAYLKNIEILNIKDEKNYEYSKILRKDHYEG